METAAPRFENLIDYRFMGQKLDRSRFCSINVDGVRIRQVFTNHRCHGFDVFFSPENNPEIRGDVDCFDIWKPEYGCMVMAEIDSLEPMTEPLVNTVGVKVITHHYVSGYAAFIFNGTSWQHWQRPHDVRVYSDAITDGLQIAIVGLRDKELVRVNSREHRHELIIFEHALDYCVGKRSLADILALVEMEERLRLYRERQMIYGRLLILTRKLKGAVRSKTAAEIEDLLMELVGEKLPF